MCRSSLDSTGVLGSASERLGPCVLLSLLSPQRPHSRPRKHLEADGVTSVQGCPALVVGGKAQRRQPTGTLHCGARIERVACTVPIEGLGLSLLVYKVQLGAHWDFLPFQHTGPVTPSDPMHTQGPVAAWDHAQAVHSASQPVPRCPASVVPLPPCTASLRYVSPPTLPQPDHNRRQCFPASHQNTLSWGEGEYKKRAGSQPTLCKIILPAALRFYSISPAW